MKQAMDLSDWDLRLRTLRFEDTGTDPIAVWKMMIFEF